MWSILSGGNHHLMEARGSDHNHPFLMGSSIAMPMAAEQAQSMELQGTWAWVYGTSYLLLKEQIAETVELEDPKV